MSGVSVTKRGESCGGEAPERRLKFRISPQDGGDVIWKGVKVGADSELSARAAESRIAFRASGCQMRGWCRVQGGSGVFFGGFARGGRF